MSHDCRAVANALLDEADRLQIPLTHMAVHKLMYYANGWLLADRDEPLVTQEFEAWKDGPVQRLVYDCLKAAGASPVRARATRFDLVLRTTTIVRDNLSNIEMKFLKDIILGYGTLHAFELSKMTHVKNSPWDLIWNASNGQIHIGMTISHREIRNYFLNISHRNCNFYM